MKITRFISAACVAASVLVSCVTAGRTQDNLEQDVVEPDAVAPAFSLSKVPAFVPGEVVVQFRADAAEARQQTARARVRGTLRKRLRSARFSAWGANRDLFKTLPAGNLDLLRVPAGQSLAETIRVLQADPAVAYAEPNYIYTHRAVANDALYSRGKLWNMYSSDLPSATGTKKKTTNPFGSGAEQAWALGNIGSKQVYVAVIDEGVDFAHSDLRDNAWVNPFDPRDGVDNDGNGYIDDVNGWDFYGDDNSVYDGGKKGNTDQHGTHVAGTIGARGGNKKGVAGMNWNVSLIACKFLGPFGGSTDSAVTAIDYLIDLKARHGLNIVAINASWGGSDYSQTLRNAIVRAAQANILFVTAAGNDGYNNDFNPSYPANFETASSAGYESIISVAALAKDGTMPWWSHYGASSVDLAAPGDNVTSTLPNNKYKAFNGTSMATPHVSGAAALYAARYVGMSPLPASQIRAAILGSTIPTPSLAGKTVTGGRLDVSAF